MFTVSPGHDFFLPLGRSGSAPLLFFCTFFVPSLFEGRNTPFPHPLIEVRIGQLVVKSCCYDNRTTNLGILTSHSSGSFHTHRLSSFHFLFMKLTK